MSTEEDIKKTILKQIKIYWSGYRAGLRHYDLYPEIDIKDALEQTRFKENIDVKELDDFIRKFSNLYDEEDNKE